MGGVDWPLCVPPTVERDRRACVQHIVREIHNNGRITSLARPSVQYGLPTREQRRRKNRHAGCPGPEKTACGFSAQSVKVQRQKPRFVATTETCFTVVVCWMYRIGCEVSTRTITRPIRQFTNGLSRSIIVDVVDDLVRCSTVCPSACPSLSLCLCHSNCVEH